MGKLQDGSSGGVAGEHDELPPFEILAGSATTDEFNTVHLPLIPIACWGIDDVRFAFDSSFVDADCSGGGTRPEDIRVEFAMVKALVAAHPGCPMTLFGHADPVGTDVYNKSLSERRARAIYALLIFQSEPDTAVGYWQSISNTENWGADQRGKMQALAGGGGATGSDLMRAYMKTLSAAAPLLVKTDFLAQGAGSDRKGDFQGCSEFNPMVLFSQEKQTGFEQGKANNDQASIKDRNSQNAPNRRVLGLMFPKGSKVDPAKWPCPRAVDGITGCTDRFWSDGQSRRSTLLSGKDRMFEQTQDTFGCRFYQRLAGDSPCEPSATTFDLVVRLLNYDFAPCPLLDATVQVGSQRIPTKTDEDGIIRVTVRTRQKLIHVVYTPQGTTEELTWPLQLDLQTTKVDPGAIGRLLNLGYPADTDEEFAVQEFQEDHDLSPTGILDETTRAKLQEIHDIPGV